jgi:hypothetical protein
LKGENLRRGKVLTSERQIWRGLPSSNAGKPANNHLYRLGALIFCPRGNPDGLHIHRKTFHIRHQYFLPERIILF